MFKTSSIARLPFIVSLTLAPLLFALLLFGPNSIADEGPSSTIGEAGSGGVKHSFAMSQRGAEILQQDDDFLIRLSQFDMQARMRSGDNLSSDDYKSFIARHVLDWSEENSGIVKGVLDELTEPLARLQIKNLPLVEFIQTTGNEEGGAAYTRANAIVLTEAQLKMPRQSLTKLILHELFHVISRANPELRDQLYAILGFVPSNEILLPDALASKRITNPDAPVIQHVLKVSVGSEENVFVAPVLFAKTEYNPQQKDSMFAYLNFKLMRVQQDKDGTFSATSVAGHPVMYESSLSDFRRQIGRNTGYIIHPEEVLADNFAELMLGNTEVPDPWILTRMSKLLFGDK